MPVTFLTHLSGAPDGPTGIEVPPEIMAQLGPKKTPAVTVGLGRHSYRSTVAVRAGRFLIPVSAAHREAAGLKAGDPVEVTLDLDTAPRTVEIPADLEAALSQIGARAAFDALAPSKRKEAVRQLDEAKTPETRERRLAKIMAQFGG